MGEGLIGEWAFLHQSRGTEMPCWTARTLPGQGKQRKMLFLCLFPVRFMFLTKTSLYHVTDQLPRVYIPFPNVDWVSGWVWGVGGGGEARSG